MKNAANKSQATLRKTCLMLVVHPAMDAADLWIKAGNDKKWNLRLMRGELVADSNVPAEVDHFSGDVFIILLLLLLWCFHIYIY